MQISNAFISAIRRNILSPNTKLLGTRALSNLLGTHRNTIVSVYDELASQGWIDIKPNQGAFISPTMPQTADGSLLDITYANQTGFTFRKSALLDSPYERGNFQYSFNDGIPDVRLTQLDDLARIYSATLKRKSNRRKMDYHNQDGSPYFKEQLQGYLSLSRGLQISAANMLITRSVEMSLFIIAEVLLDPGDIVIVGALSYFSANMIFQKNGASIRTIPVDEEGIDVEALADICQKQKIRMVYVTPQQHYPTTVTLNVQRRMRLLQLAQEYHFAIVEDDHDYDFHYEKQPMLPLATLDTNGMVIYVGSFGKSLVPGFRTGFIVAPENIMLEMRKLLGIIDRQGDVLIEQALGEMIEEGVIHRHLKKSLKIYRERRDQMTRIIQQQFGEHMKITKPPGGLACWLEFKTPVNLLQLGKDAAKEQLFIPRNILYQNGQLTAIRLGFGHLTNEEMEDSFTILKMLMERQIKN
ncbi:PLP-dependent aminotransferase family protein [Sphingobacterium deserti]|uniref:aminotransferase-like domain-containing protein n=1 Tax=Sphingobacterium deserti TaxID=1229276 RepID=UPI001F4CB9A3|nr:PLP-dependent aminotransferase family protein [Sphingobacterium deserti]